MATRTKWLSLFLSALFGIISLSGNAASATDSVELYTPYTKISVPPGESIDYAIDIINNSKEIKDVEISISGMPRGWNYTIKSATWNVNQISVLPGERKSFTLKVDVPLKVNKGSYQFKVVAGTFDVLALVVIVSEQGTYKTEFTTTQANMQGQASSTFSFNTNLQNRTSDKQLYALIAEAPRGWTVMFKSNFQLVTSVSIEANSTLNLQIDIKSPDRIEAGTFKIPVNAVTSTTSARLDLEAVITGTYTMELSTPTGLLSTDITAGEVKRVELILNNTGSSELNNIILNFTAPINWDITFNPEKIEKLQPGKTAQVFATIKADKKAIAGDYVAGIDAKTPETSSKLSFRISVETSIIRGWIGVLIIIIALGSVYYLFRKYGRR